MLTDQLPVVVDAAAVIEKHQRDGRACTCGAWPGDWAEHVALALHTARVLAYAITTAPEPWFRELMDDVKAARP